MIDKDRVLEQLEGLEGWAGFIFESLSVTRGNPMLEQLLGRESLKGLCREAYLLMDRLHVLRVEAQSKSPQFVPIPDSSVRKFGVA